jgi:hypothetical protein
VRGFLNRFIKSPICQPRDPKYVNWLILTEPAPNPQEPAVAYGQYAVLILAPLFAVHGFFWFWSVLLSIYSFVGDSKISFMSLLVFAQIVLLFGTIAFAARQESEWWTALNLVLYSPFAVCDISAMAMLALAIALCTGKRRKRELILPHNPVPRTE